MSHNRTEFKNPYSAIELGALTHLEEGLTSSSAQLGIRMTKVNLPPGIDAEKFEYKVPSHNQDNLKTLLSFIQKKLINNMNDELKEAINAKKTIIVLL